MARVAAFDFDEKAVQKVITNLDGLKKELPGRVTECLSFFPGVDRTIGGYEGLITAQDCLPDNRTRDKFAAGYSVLLRLWEALSPDPCLGPPVNEQSKAKAALTDLFDKAFGYIRQYY
nr:hypothetical protein [Desulfobacula sp.]